MSDNAETATADVETSVNAYETTMPESSEGTENSDNTDSESTEEDESVDAEIFEDSETEENDSKAVNEDEETEIPQTGDNRKIFPAIATLLVAGVSLAYCIVKGKKTK